MLLMKKTEPIGKNGGLNVGFYVKLPQILKLLY
jgi:hypothetical protein